MQHILGKNFIAGTRSGKGPASLRSIDAATGQELDCVFFQATPQEVDEAARAAQDAFPIFRNLLPSRRAEFLEAIAQELDLLGDDFISLVSRETALPAVRIQGERARTSNQMRMFAKLLSRGDYLGARIDHALPERKPAPRVDLRQYRIGVGPVAVFGASNFPLAFSTAGGDTAAALAAGCPVIVKAHSGHMATADLVGCAIDRAAKRTGMPLGVFNMIFGSRVGEALVKHPAVQAVGFTGSLSGGTALCKIASERAQPIPVFAEMSSINPVFVLPEALKVRGAAIANELGDSVTLGAGQFCTNPGLVIGLKSPEFSRFTEYLVHRLNQAPAQTMLNAGGLSSYSAGVHKLHAHTGITHLAGSPQTAGLAEAQLFKADAALLMEGDSILQEEVFGPTTILVEAADTHELRSVLKAIRGQLTATLIAEGSDLSEHEWLVPMLEEKVGRILVNGYPTGVEVCDAMVHGGPFPATSDARGTSVGTAAIDRFLRPVCYQNYPDALLPDALKNANPLGINRLVDGVWSSATS